MMDFHPQNASIGPETPGLDGTHQCQPWFRNPSFYQRFYPSMTQNENLGLEEKVAVADGIRPSEPHILEDQVSNLYPLGHHSLLTILKTQPENDTSEEIKCFGLSRSLAFCCELGHSVCFLWVIGPRVVLCTWWRVSVSHTCVSRVLICQAMMKSEQIIIWQGFWSTISCPC